MRRIAKLLAVLGLAACVTPSIPIPPPDPSQMTFEISMIGGQSQAVFTYPPTRNYVGGFAVVYDRNNGLAVGEDAHADGSVGPTLPLPAMPGDSINVTIENGTQTVSTCVVLRQGPQDPTLYCP